MSQDQLTALVTLRRDATVEPAPKSVEQLAARLLRPQSTAAACSPLTLPQLQVAEAAAALGDGCTTARLAALLGVSDDDPDLETVSGRRNAGRPPRLRPRAGLAASRRQPGHRDPATPPPQPSPSGPTDDDMVTLPRLRDPGDLARTLIASRR